MIQCIGNLYQMKIWAILLQTIMLIGEQSEFMIHIVHLIRILQMLQMEEEVIIHLNW